MKIKNVVVAVSGGVDSAVTALLLKKRNFNVEAVFMENWDIKDENGQCSVDADFADASELCSYLNIRLHKVNFVKQYWNEVFSNLVVDYENGLTPNPDVLCNRRIKFNYLFDYVTKNLNADAMATGHYACTSFGPYLENYKETEAVKLQVAKDRKKDQMLFLCQIEQRALRRAMFPVGPLMKSEVKSIAKQNGLGKFASKKESMGICFIGKRDFQDFIQDYIADKPGDFIDVDSGKVVGKHRGFHQWTIGQRANIAGLSKAYFIARKNVNNNSILLASGTDHPILFSKLFFTSHGHWITEKPKELCNGNILECDFKFQHHHDWAPCTIFECSRGLIVKLKLPIRALTPGQYAVFCRNNECLGSARIISTPISEFDNHSRLIIKNI